MLTKTVLSHEITCEFVFLSMKAVHGIYNRDSATEVSYLTAQST